MNHNQLIELLNELGMNLTPTTLAAIVADLSGNIRLSPNLDMVVSIMTEQGEANAGPDDFAQLVSRAEDNGRHQ